jgi:alkaline phosphatase D
VLAAPLLARPALGRSPLPGYPFTLGVASGDPAPDSVVLWTRLAPDPMNGGGMPGQRFPVQWKVAHDDRMSDVVREGTVLAEPESAHSVHVEVDGLQPSRQYFYQFRAGSELSVVGRTRTLPPAGAPAAGLTMAIASCQNFPVGYFAAYRHMAEQDLDLVLHLGDYIYEGGLQGSLGRGHHPGVVCRTLDDYRTRHAQYKGDLDLQTAHQAGAWMVVMDDHDVVNNWAAEDTDPDTPVEVFLQRRTAAMQAYYEHMPMRRTSLPQGPDMRMYRRLEYGDLATISLLDTRQYRSDQPCGSGITARCADALDEAQTMTGPEQERWLLDGLGASRARWNVIAQQTIMADFDFRAGAGEEYQMDNWAGYAAARNRLLGFVHHRRPSNPVVLSGDIHATFVNDLKADFADPGSETLATEFVGTSITSNKPNDDVVRAALPDNPHVRYYNGSRRGYVRFDVRPDRWSSDLLFVDDVTDENSAVRSLARYVVEDGQPGAVEA